MAYAKSFDEFFDNRGEWTESILLLRQIAKSTGMDEALKWGAPSYMHLGKNVVGLGAFKNYCGLWFHQGGLLKDSKKKLMNTQEGKTQAMRQWRFHSLTEIKKDKALILSYIKEAIKNQEDGKVIKPKRGKPLIIPSELKSILAKNKSLNNSYEKLSMSARREYAEYISQAKSEATKEKRLEKIKPLILAGKGLHDKYK